jgi:hypothetical protein
MLSSLLCRCNFFFLYVFTIVVDVSFEEFSNDLFVGKYWLLSILIQPPKLLVVLPSVPAPGRAELRIDFA